MPSSLELWRGRRVFHINHAGQQKLTAAALPTQSPCAASQLEDRTMRYASSLVTLMAACGLGLLALPAQAAPAGGMAGELKRIGGEGANVEHVRHGCYWHRGHWHCSRYRYRGYSYRNFDSRERRTDRIVCGRYSYFDGNACQPGRRPR
jgi:hypothetical protein